MEFVFFFYGLAFFLMGFAVLNYPKTGSSFFLARRINWIAYFGIIHGVNEWFDMFILIRALESHVLLEYFRMVTLPASFMCLVFFGAEMIANQNARYRWFKIFPYGILLIWAVLFFSGEPSGLRWDIWSRYILCTAGAFLTGVSLLLHSSEIQITENKRLMFNLKAAGVGFVVYAFVAGSIVPDSDLFPSSVLNYSLFTDRIGIPVQVLRSFCAIVMAYHLIRVLSLFQWETEQSLFNCEYRFKAIVDTSPVLLFIADPELEVTFIEGRGMEPVGIKATQMAGKSLPEIFSQVPYVLECAQKALAGEEFTRTIAIGHSYFEIFFGPFKSRRGIIHGVIGVSVDVTEQKTAQLQLDSYRFEMEKNRALAAIGTLGAEIANDMSVPLHESKIMLQKALGGLKKTIGAEEVRADIKHGMKKISSAIQKLDTFCAKANLPSPLLAKPLDIDQIVQRILAVFQESAQRAMVKITTQGTDLLPVMRITPRELEQIVYTMIQQVIHSADGVHLHTLDIVFSLQDHFLCMQFSEYCPDSAAEDATEAPATVPKAFPDKEKFNFEFSVLKGITEANEGTITISANSKGGFFYEIRLPVSD